MNILIACKIVPDDQDVKVTEDGSLDFSSAHQIVSTYDLNAIEAAVQVASANEGSSVKAISVGSKAADNSKTKKGILARGVDELFLTADDSADNLDARSTACELAKLANEAGAWDALFVGDGSADLYARQTGVQLASVLGVPYVSAVIAAEHKDGKLECKRLLETQMEKVEVSLPAVVAIAPDFAVPRIAGMKDILAAGKKPMNVQSADNVEAPAVEQVLVKAPQLVDRKKQVFDDLDQFVAVVKAVL